MICQIGARRFLPAGDWFERSVAGRLQPGDLVLTFDDNLRCQYDVALPVLRSHGLTGMFFVYTSVLGGTLERLEIYRHFRSTAFEHIDHFYGAFFSFIDSSPIREVVQRAIADFNPDEYLKGYVYLSRLDKVFRFVRDRVLGREQYERLMDGMLDEYKFDIVHESKRLWMNADMLRTLEAGGHVIGLHSHTHPTLLEALDEKAQRAEFEQNSEVLALLLGKRPRAMSHPNNSYSDVTLRILRDLGVQIGFRANMLEATSSTLEQPRHNHSVIHRLILGN